MQSCKFHTAPMWTVAIALLQTSLKEGQLTWPGELAWPDLAPKYLQNVGNECPLKFRKFQLVIFSRLAMEHEKPEEGGGGLMKPPAKNRVKTTLIVTITGITQKTSAPSQISLQEALKRTFSRCFHRKKSGAVSQVTADAEATGAPWEFNLIYHAFS